MAFKKMVKAPFPPRHWSLVGYAGCGKSTFAAQMQGPKLVIDADHRFDEVLNLSNDDVFSISDNAADNVDPDRVASLLYDNMPDSGVKTIIVDSLTAIITPLTIQAMIDRDKGRERNLMAGFKNKALAMRQLQDAVTRWGTDVLWIYHHMDARDAKAREITRSTVSQTEIARLTRSINMQLEVVTDGDKHGIKIAWARRGRSGITLWDDSGYWVGMPERIEKEAYEGLSQVEQDAIEAQTPTVFPSAEVAISWGLEQGAFANVEESKRLYNVIKQEYQPKSAQDMAALWITEVNQRASNAGTPNLQAV